MNEDSKMNLEIGDRVYVVDKIDGAFLPGATGTVICVNGANHVGVAFDNPIPMGHACGGLCANGYGRFSWHPGIELRKLPTTFDDAPADGFDKLFDT